MTGFGKGFFFPPTMSLIGRQIYAYNVHGVNLRLRHANNVEWKVVWSTSFPFHYSAPPHSAVFNGRRLALRSPVSLVNGVHSELAINEPSHSVHLP